MRNNQQSSNQIQKRPWAALWSVLLLAPLAMAPKGCDSAVVGDNNCADMGPDLAAKYCAPSAGSSNMGSAGSAGSISVGAGGGSAGSSMTGSAGAPADGICGGLNNRTCASGEYCLFDVKTAACGSGDQTGVCTPKPQVCTEIYAPVCACDSKTYANECEAAAKGFSVLHTGACEDPSSGTRCGLPGQDCAKSEFCDFPNTCGVVNSGGTCKKIPDACDTVYDPVCGCDSVTYSNACSAAAKGVSVLHTGKCETSTTGTTCGGLVGAPCPKGQACIYSVEANCGSFDMPGTCMATGGACPQNIDLVCGCDGKTYDNACTANALGISVVQSGACPTAGTGCGGDSKVGCAADEYCDYPISASCGEADATGVCTKKSTGACITIYDPVCGCDGKTYGNSCEASLAAASIRAKGACP